MASVLLVEDDEALRLTQSLYLRQEGFEVRIAADRAAALQVLESSPLDLVVTDLRLGRDSGLDVLRDTRELQPSAEVLVITGYGSVDSAVQAMRDGAYDYLTKPVDPEHMVRVLLKAIERQRLRRQVTTLRDQIAKETGLNEIVAVSSLMKEVMERIVTVAQSDATVLIEGESGTGKELMARLIHARGDRAGGPFLGINCGAMPESLLESELFGHMRGSFTGAHKDQKGLFEAADGGTLFLDEIAEISSNFQVKLLRTLQEHAIRRIGDTREIQVNVRVVAASNQDLTRMVREGRFRQDLFFRVKVIPIFLPPLRQRTEDILPLAEHFLQRLSDRMGRRKPELSASAQHKLLAYGWPGNVRELENTLERALIFNKTPRIDEQDLVVESCLPASGETGDSIDTWGLSLAEAEKRHILTVLAHCRNNKMKAASILKIGYNTLWRKLKQYGQSDNT
ncbi:MAG: sigma-54-dependent transcriptional regulator [Syntrophobacteraceae bacterium]